MKVWGRYLGQGLGYLLFIVLIGYFSNSPAYTHVPADKALIKLTFTHAGKRLKPFHDTRTKEDFAKLPPQLRARHHSRERSALRVEFSMDGKVLYQAVVPPRGLSHDLPSPIYKRFIVPAGTHRFRIRMADDIRREGYSYASEQTISLEPLQTLVIDFDNIRGKFVFR